MWPLNEDWFREEKSNTVWFGNFLAGSTPTYSYGDPLKIVNAKDKS